jgi:hypothetical protein
VERHAALHDIEAALALDLDVRLKVRLVVLLLVDHVADVASRVEQLARRHVRYHGLLAHFFEADAARVEVWVAGQHAAFFVIDVTRFVLIVITPNVQNYSSVLQLLQLLGRQLHSPSPSPAPLAAGGIGTPRNGLVFQKRL